MLRKILAATLSLALLVGLSACGATDNASSSGASQSAGGLTVASLNQLDAWPAYAAMKDDVADKYGISYEMKLYKAGFQLVEDSALEKWQIGDVGAVPALLGVLNRHLSVVGIAADESDANALMVKAKSPLLKEESNGVLGSADAVRGKAIYTTQASSAHRLVAAYLKKLDLTESDVNLQYASQADCLAALGDGRADIVSLWAPNTYEAEEIAGGAKTLAKGSDLGVTSYMVYVADSAWAEKNKDAIARFLATVGHEAGAFEEVKDADLVSFFKDYAKADLDEKRIADERKSHQLFTVEEQLALMSDGDLQKSLDDVATFFLQINRFADSNYGQLTKMNFGITDEYLKAAQKLEEKAS